MENKAVKYKPLLMLIIGAIGISFAPIFVKMIDPEKMGPSIIGFWRMFIGAVILLTIGFIQKGGLTINRVTIKWAAIAGLIFSIDIFIWHKSILYSGAGIATILGNMQVFITAIFGFLIFKEKLTAKYIGAVLVAIAGVILLVGIGSDLKFSSTYIKGIIFGFSTAFAYGSYLLILKKTGQDKEVSPVFLIALISLFASIFLGIAGYIEEGAILPPDGYTFFVLFSLGLVAQSMGWLAIYYSLPKLDVSRSGLILLLQPTLATLWGFLFFAENLTLLQLVGAVLTLGAIYVGSVYRGKR